MVAWATNNRFDRDGKVYRAAIVPPDPDGITLGQAATAVKKVAGLSMIQPNWGYREVMAQLTQGRGLVVTGMYSALPRQYRYQDNADFSHAMFVPYLTNTQTWDSFFALLDDHQKHVYDKFGPKQLLRLLSPSQLHALHNYNQKLPPSVMRVYDPLNKDMTSRGVDIPQTVMWPFITSGAYHVAYIPLEPA